MQKSSEFIEISCALFNSHKNVLHAIDVFGWVTYNCDYDQIILLFYSFLLCLLFGIPLLRKFFTVPHVVIHLFIHPFIYSCIHTLHGFVDFCCFQLIIICCYCYPLQCSNYLRFDQWGSQAGLHILLIWFYHLGSISLFSGTSGCSWLICFFLSQPMIHQFLQGVLVPFSGEWYL